MPSAVDYRNAEQGQTVRFPFTVLASGVPVVPASLVIDVQDAPTSGSVALLAGVAAGDPGKYYADWDIPAAQPVGYYRLVVTPSPTGAVDPITFEVFAKGHFQQSQSYSAATTVSQIQRISAARDEQAFIAAVRAILLDHPQLNRLTAGRETSDGMIAMAANMAISMFNTMPPVFANPYSFTNFPSVAWLTIGTIGWVLSSSAILRHRNQLSYQDGGITVDTENAQGMTQLGQQWWGMYTAWVPEYKASLNLNMAFGASPTGVHSEYAFLGTLLGAPSYPETGLLLR